MLVAVGTEGAAKGDDVVGLTRGDREPEGTRRETANLQRETALGVGRGRHNLDGIGSERRPR